MFVSKTVISFYVTRLIDLPEVFFLNTWAVKLAPKGALINQHTVAKCYNVLSWAFNLAIWVRMTLVDFKFGACHVWRSMLVCSHHIWRVVLQKVKYSTVLWENKGSKVKSPSANLKSNARALWNRCIWCKENCDEILKCITGFKTVFRHFHTVKWPSVNVPS